MSCDQPQWASREGAAALQLRRFSNAEETLARQASCATSSASCTAPDTVTCTPRSMRSETNEQKPSRLPLCEDDATQAVYTTAVTVAIHKRPRSTTSSVASTTTEELAVPTLAQLRHGLSALHRDLTALQHRPARPSVTVVPVDVPGMPSLTSVAAHVASQPAGSSLLPPQAGCVEEQLSLNDDDAAARLTPHDDTQGDHTASSPQTPRMHDLPTIPRARCVSDTAVCPPVLPSERLLRRVIPRPATASQGHQVIHSFCQQSCPTDCHEAAQQETLSSSQACLCRDVGRHVSSSPCQQKRRASVSPRGAPTLATRLDSPGCSRVRDGRICVVVRKRPSLPSELGTDCVRVQGHTVRLTITRQRVDLTQYTESNDFDFDDVFDERATNEMVHRQGVCSLLSVVLQGGSASCFAYGQTGSGKTHTMMGRDGGEAAHGMSEGGLYLLGAVDLFAQLSSAQVLSVAFYEIYCNSLFDLLQERSPVVLREDAAHRVHLRGLSRHVVPSPEELCALVQRGLVQRSTGSTSANERSSRSHAVLTMSITDRTRPGFCGVVNYVDLAGSERASDTVSEDRQTRLEGAEINKSLLALKECIRALDEKRRHVPFRGSKLTEVLRESFVGNSRTVMIANVSPTSVNYEHTVNTLRYAFRVKGLSIPVVTPSRARNAPRPCTPVPRIRNGGTPRSPRVLHEWGNVDRAAPGKPQKASPSTGYRTAMRRPHCGDARCIGKKQAWQEVNLVVDEQCQRAVDAAVESGETGTTRDTTRRAVSAAAVRRASGEVPHLLPDAAVCLGMDELTRSLSQGSAGAAGAGGAVSVSEMEAQLKERVLRQLQRDLGTEIQRILDERDALISGLRSENAELRQRIRRLESDRARATPPSSPSETALLLPPCHLTPSPSFSLP